MTTEEEVRRLLDERGVEYTVDHGYREFFWDFGKSGTARASAIGTKGLVQMIVTGITPAQAVEATLGRNEPPYDRLIERLREDWGIDASWDGLRRFWCVQLTEDGVRMRDEHEATPGRGTCTVKHDVVYGIRGSEIDQWECSECGHMWWSIEDTPACCPRCGCEVIS